VGGCLIIHQSSWTVRSLLLRSQKSIENVVCPSTVENIFPTNQTPRCARILQKQHTAKTHKKNSSERSVTHLAAHSKHKYHSSSTKMTSNPISITTPNQFLAGDKPKVPKGRSVSGRSWKFRPQKRASSLITKTVQNGRSTTWEKKMKEKELRRALMEREREMKEVKRQGILAKNERRLENEKRRMENEFKVASKSAQTLGKNADVKLKALNKKQLRQIKKTRMNTKTGAIEFVSAYKK
jgi:hypothetical protein